MSRRRHLLCYDIRDPKRLRKVHEIAMDFGYPLQYSVFVCDLNKQEMVHLRWRLSETIVHNKDSIVFVDLGDTESRGRNCFSFLGANEDLPTHRSRIY